MRACQASVRQRCRRAVAVKLALQRRIIELRQCCASLDHLAAGEVQCRDSAGYLGRYQYLLVRYHRADCFDLSGQCFASCGFGDNRYR